MEVDRRARGSSSTLRLARLKCLSLLSEFDPSTVPPLDADAN